jgi:hypothetical protein
VSVAYQCVSARLQYGYSTLSAGLTPALAEAFCICVTDDVTPTHTKHSPSRKITAPTYSTLAQVDSTPWRLPSWVPLHVILVTTLSPQEMVSSMRLCQSGKAERTVST